MKTASNSTATHSRKSSQKGSSLTTSNSKQNRAQLRDQNLKLKSEVKVLQQALVNLSLNDLELKVPQNQSYNVRNEQNLKTAQSLTSTNLIQFEEPEEGICMNLCGQPQILYAEPNIQLRQLSYSNKPQQQLSFDQVSQQQNRDFIKNRVNSIMNTKSYSKENILDSVEIGYSTSQTKLNDRIAKASATSPTKRQAYLKLPSEQSMSLDTMKQQVFSNENVKYQQEIENLKRILSEINKKENEIIEKIQLQEIPPQRTAQLQQVQSLPQQKIEPLKIFLKDEGIQVSDSQTIQMLQKIKDLQQIIDQQNMQNQDLQSRLNSQQSEQNLRQQEITYLQIKIKQLEKEQQFTLAENERLRNKIEMLSQKACTQSVCIQTDNILKEISTNKIEQNFTTETKQYKQTPTGSSDPFNLTLYRSNMKNDTQIYQKTLASPVSYSSYLQTPTRSALQQQIVGVSSSTKKIKGDESIQIQTQQQRSIKKSDYIIVNTPTYQQQPVQQQTPLAAQKRMALSSFISKPQTQSFSQLNTEHSQRSLDRKQTHQQSHSSLKKDNSVERIVETHSTKPPKQDPCQLSDSKSTNSKNMTPNGSKKKLFQKATTILRSRYETHQEFTPVRGGSQLKGIQTTHSHREHLTTTVSSSQNLVPIKPANTLLSQYTTKASGTVFVDIGGQTQQTMDSEVKPKKNRGGKQNDSDIQLNTSSSAAKNNSAFKIKRFSISRDQQSSSIVRYSNNVASKKNIPEWSTSLNSFNELKDSGENVVLLRKARLDEERLRELQAKIQAKDEKIQHLQELKKQEQQMRTLTYDERKEKFKAEVKERRTNLSKTPVRGENQSHKKQGQQLQHQQSYSQFEKLMDNQTSPAKSPSKTERLETMTLRINASIHSSGQKSSKNLFNTQQKRKIQVDYEDEEEIPQPLNVKISPIERKDKFQYEL